MKTKFALIIIALMFMAVAAMGQDTYRVKLTGSYSQLDMAEDEAPCGFKRFRTNLRGGVGEGELRATDVLGLHLSAVGQVGGYYGRASNGVPIPGLPKGTQAYTVASNPVRLYTFLGGPQLGKTFGNGKVTVFGRGLVGSARLSGIRGQRVDTELAWSAGGGVDLNPSKHLVVRAVTVDYLNTRFGPFNQIKPVDFGVDSQDSVRIGFGLGWRF